MCSELHKKGAIPSGEVIKLTVDVISTGSTA